MSRTDLGQVEDWSTRTAISLLSNPSVLAAALIYT